MQSRDLRLNICNILSPYALKERIRSGSQDNWTQKEHATTKKSKDRKQAPEYRELTNWRTIEIYEGDQKRLRMHELKSIMCFLRFRNFVLLVIWNLIVSYIFFMTFWAWCIRQCSIMFFKYWILCSILISCSSLTGYRCHMKTRDAANIIRYHYNII